MGRRQVKIKRDQYVRQITGDLTTRNRIEYESVLDLRRLDEIKLEGVFDPIMKEKKKPMPKKMQAGLKRYYVGSNNLTADWTHGKLAEAVAHACQLVEKNGYEEVFVVEIKRIVRRRAQPVVVEPPQLLLAAAQYLLRNQ